MRQFSTPIFRFAPIRRRALNHFVERSGVGDVRHASEPRYDDREHSGHRPRHEDQAHYKQHDDYKYKKKKKESFLSDLFDF